MNEQADNLPVSTASEPLEPWQSPGVAAVRRFSFELPVTMTIEVDVLGGPDEARSLIRNLVANIRQDPNGWQSTLKRMYPEIKGSKPKGDAQNITLVGPGIGDDLERQQALNARLELDNR